MIGKNRTVLWLFHDMPHEQEHGDIVVPASCFTVCGDAHTEAQIIGNKPELCAAGSAFREFYEGCRYCVVYFQGKLQPGTVILSGFQQYIDYCGTLVGLPTLPPSPSTRPSFMTTSLSLTTDHSSTTSGITITPTSTLPHTSSSSTTELSYSTYWTSTISDGNQSISIVSPVTPNTSTSCLSSISSLVSTTPISNTATSSSEVAGTTIFDSSATTTPISTSESTTERSIHTSNTVMVSAVVGSVVGVALLFILGMAYWKRRVKSIALNSSCQPELGGRSVLILNPQGPLQEMAEHHGYNELDVPKIWYELDARSLRSLNRSLRWAMSGARSPGYGSQNRGGTPEV
ncbi:hypothetical protein QBC41DRAFT_137083 [Cercophora samala]|uniref:Uncharacterized protein n=1 Tax=Cercophora samala TaxID=330535 RepID=A0AA40DBH2_9PEZI|nr:hypothetical protein QBC41DRAFT_137083 [Cercophora samala]